MPKKFGKPVEAFAIKVEGVREVNRLLLWDTGHIEINVVGGGELIETEDHEYYIHVLVKVGDTKIYGKLRIETLTACHLRDNYTRGSRSIEGEDSG